jgi:hypothetical protein
MTYSYTQISQYLTCPRRYRYRYLDGWKEKDNRAAMLFGRAFEQALGAYFRREDHGDAMFREWSTAKSQPLRFSHNDTWDRMFEQGIMLLTRFCQDNRVRIRQPRRNLQIKSSKHFPAAMISWLTSTPSANWTALAVCWSGRPLPVATQKSRPVCWLLILNSSATRG